MSATRPQATLGASLRQAARHSLEALQRLARNLWELVCQLTSRIRGQIASIASWLRHQTRSAFRPRARPTLRQQPEQFREVRRLLTKLATEIQQAQILVTDLIQDSQQSEHRGEAASLAPLETSLQQLQDSVKDYRVAAADCTHKDAKQAVKQLQKEYQAIGVRLQALQPEQ